MKSCILFCLCFILLVTPAYSKTMYITEDLHVMVRTKPGKRDRIIAMPESGTQVEVLKKSKNGWSRVRLANKKEGWMLTRYLTPGPPSKMVVAKLSTEYEVLKQRVTSLIEENTLLKAEQNDLREALAEQTRGAGALRKSYQELESSSSDVLSLKASHKKASEDLAKRTKRLAELEEKIKGLEKNQNIRWFMGGAAVLLIGLLIGFMARRSKRRSSLL